MEALSAKFQSAVTTTASSLETTRINPLKRASHVCSIKCYDEISAIAQPQSGQKKAGGFLNFGRGNGGIDADETPMAAAEVEKSARKLHSCLEMCLHPAMMANQIMKQEFDQLQNRAQRASQNCHDDATANITPDMQSNQSAMEALQKKYETCVSAAIKDQIDNLDPMKKRIDSRMAELAKVDKN